MERWRHPGDSGTSPLWMKTSSANGLRGSWCASRRWLLTKPLLDENLHRAMKALKLDLKTGKLVPSRTVTPQERELLLKRSSMAFSKDGTPRLIQRLLRSKRA